MNQERTLDRAVPYLLCPVTMEKMDAGLYIRTNGKGGAMPLVTEEYQVLNKKIHNKCIGISPTMCDDAKAKIGDGFYLVEIDMEKTNDRSNPYRTGNVIGLKKHAWAKMFKSPFPTDQWAYVSAPAVANIQRNLGV